MEKFFEDVRQVTLADLERNDVQHLITSTVEELGEFVVAVKVEEGRKNKKLDESSREEAVDVVLCALSLFYARGGTTEGLIEYGAKKLEKWKKSIEN